MSQDDVVAAGGPSDRKQTQIEKGIGPDPSLTTLAKVDKALRWEKGSANATLHGGEPVEASPPSVDTSKLKALEEALARHGVDRIAARRHAGHGAKVEFNPAAVDQLIDLLNSVPAPRTLESDEDPDSTAR